MKTAFLTLERWTSALSLWCACAMLALAAALGMFQIIMRFVLEQPAEWTEVLIRFSLIWMVFLAIPTAFRQGAMVSVDVLYRWSPPRLRRVLDGVVALAALTLIAIIVWWGWDYAVRGRVQTMAGLESLSMFWAYVALPVGGVFSALGIVGNLIDPRRMELETAQ
ncbi:MAG: TRAP transporter small permease [Nitrospirota bacterium]|jgi:TRAP-type C4-dicarboxylate transport system permease small subunit